MVLVMKKLLYSLVVLFSPFTFIHSAAPLDQDVVELLIPKLNSDRIEYFFVVLALKFSRIFLHHLLRAG